MIRTTTTTISIICFLMKEIAFHGDWYYLCWMYWFDILTRNVFVCISLPFCEVSPLFALIYIYKYTLSKWICAWHMACLLWSVLVCGLWDFMWFDLLAHENWDSAINWTHQRSPSLQDKCVVAFFIPWYRWLVNLMMIQDGGQIQVWKMPPQKQF